VTPPACPVEHFDLYPEDTQDRTTLIPPPPDTERMPAPELAEPWPEERITEVQCPHPPGRP
jgi:hypothetical protein